MSVRIKREIGKLNSRALLDNTPLYPGNYVFTWIMIIPGVWQLCSIEPEKEQPR